MSNNDEMSEFFTLEKANAGIKIPLFKPDGTRSDHWVRIRGVDSDEFRFAEAESRRDALRIAGIEDKRERAEAVAASKRELIGSLVIAWSFEKECTPGNVREFLKKAPQLADAIDRQASNRALFYSSESSS